MSNYANLTVMEVLEEELEESYLSPALASHFSHGEVAKQEEVVVIRGSLKISP